MDLPSFTTLILSRKDQKNGHDLHLFNTRYTWPGTHVRFSWFILLSLLILSNRDCSSKDSSITTNKSRWYFPSLSHTPVKTVFLLICTPGSFQPTMALVPRPGILVLCHLQHCSHTPGLNYAQWNSYSEWPWYMQKWKQQGAPYSPLLFIHYIHSLNTCVASLLQTNLQVENFQTCKTAF